MPAAILRASLPYKATIRAAQGIAPLIELFIGLTSDDLVFVGSGGLFGASRKRDQRQCASQCHVGASRKPAESRRRADRLCCPVQCLVPPAAPTEQNEA